MNSNNMQTTDNLQGYCYICCFRYCSLHSLYHHLMYSHSVEDLTIGLILTQLLPKVPQLLESSLLEMFLGRYPHFRPHHQDGSLLQRSPDLFANCSTLMNFVGGSYPSTPVKTLQQQQEFLSLMSATTNSTQDTSYEVLDLSPNRKPNIDEELRPRPFRRRLCSDASMATLSQQSTETEIDVTSLSQPMASVDGKSPSELLDIGGERKYKSPESDFTPLSQPMTSADDRSPSDELLDSGERKFKCPECPSTYKLKAHLKRHQKSAHSEDRPYTCHMCTKSFKLKELLNQHVLTHNIKNPFKCEACRCKFATASDLSKHKSTHHNDSAYKCFHCKLKFSSLCFMYTHVHIAHNCVLQCAKCGDLSRKDHMPSNKGTGSPNKKPKTLLKNKEDNCPVKDFKPSPCSDKRNVKQESSPIDSGLRSVLGDGI